MDAKATKAARRKLAFIKRVGRGGRSVGAIMKRMKISVAELGRWSRLRGFRQALEREMAGRALERELNLVMGAAAASGEVVSGEADATKLRLVGAARRVKLGEVGGAGAATGKRSYRHPDAGRVLEEIAREQEELRKEREEAGKTAGGGMTNDEIRMTNQ